VTSGSPPSSARGHIWVSAATTTIVLVPALLVGNILPWVNQWHGWPLTYMVREMRVPGGLSMFYGPWPLDDPPLEEFRAWALAFNVAVGVGLVLSAAASGAYILGIRNRPLQFSLLWLFLLMTFVAVLLALTPLTIRLLHGVDMQWTRWGLLNPLSRLVLNGTSFGVMVVGAHFFVSRASQWARPPRWIQLHAVTWITSLVTCGPFLHHALLVLRLLSPAGARIFPDGSAWTATAGRWTITEATPGPNQLVHRWKTKSSSQSTLSP
jgi:hypothetical protein